MSYRDDVAGRIEKTMAVVPLPPATVAWHLYYTGDTRSNSTWARGPFPAVAIAILTTTVSAAAQIEDTNTPVRPGGAAYRRFYFSDPEGMDEVPGERFVEAWSDGLGPESYVCLLCPWGLRWCDSENVVFSEGAAEEERVKRDNDARRQQSIAKTPIA